MLQSLTQNQRAYIAGFLDGDGSIYVRAKPNPTYRFGFQIAPYIVFFQSQSSQERFGEICKLISVGHLRIRSDGILEYIINRIDEIKMLLECVRPFAILKRRQIDLMLKIIESKSQVENEDDFEKLLQLVNSYRELNYSKKRKQRSLTP
ncbi:MAG: hypothetical protein HY220_00725 [Candidatus Sungbacteria bacterium]|uniref:Homing endonuclease LAGLIDADG domain-containing protein n=1 Tax=Candidatus Sungiibacteriota bacterium TaxID=2750080 RepID=A0A9D6QTT4_9BACT|nr:hypothetical protein [Candidatus Sungbacteria bacterium]